MNPPKTPSPIVARRPAQLLLAAAGAGALAAGYVGTAAAWVVLIELLSFLAIAVAAAIACPSLDGIGSHQACGRPDETPARDRMED